MKKLSLKCKTILAIAVFVIIVLAIAVLLFERIVFVVKWVVVPLIVVVSAVHFYKKLRRKYHVAKVSIRD